MSTWTELNGTVTFHEKDHVSIYECFKEIVDTHYGLECLFSFTEPNRKWNDNITSYFRVAIDCDVGVINDILNMVTAKVYAKNPKKFMMDLCIRTRLLI